MKYIVAKTLHSVRHKLNPKKLNGCFEIFGYDFMCDDDLTVWLIEVNVNPSLDYTSKLLKKLIPRMIDEAFKYTIDKEFVNP